MSRCLISTQRCFFTAPLLLYIFHDVIVYCAVAVLIDVHALDCVLSFKPAKLVLQIAVNVNVALMVSGGELFHLNVGCVYLFVGAYFQAFRHLLGGCLVVDGIVSHEIDADTGNGSLNGGQDFAVIIHELTYRDA